MDTDENGQNDVSKLPIDTKITMTGVTSEDMKDHSSAVKVTLERQVTSPRETLMYVIMLIFLDLAKMMCGYALKYYNHDVYPVKQTLIVLAIELMKLCLILHQMIHDGSLQKISISLLFAVPSLIYSINNNLFLYALNFTSPAVWSILTQSRVIITACVYRVLFKRKVTYLQWFALLLLCMAIVVTKTSGDAGSIYLEPAAFFIAGTVSVLSVTAGIFMEYLFKNNKRSFAEQQFQLYSFSAMFAAVFYSAEVYSTRIQTPETQAGNNTTPYLTNSQTDIITNGLMANNILPIMLLCTVQFGAMSGLVTASVIRKLDNIVKIYSQSLTGIMNAVLSAFLFPRKFTIDWRYAIALILVLIAISLYERKHIKFSTEDSPQSSATERSDRST